MYIERMLADGVDVACTFLRWSLKKELHRGIVAARAFTTVQLGYVEQQEPKSAEEFHIKSQASTITPLCLFIWLIVVVDFLFRASRCRLNVVRAFPLFFLLAKVVG